MGLRGPEVRARLASGLFSSSHTGLLQPLCPKYSVPTTPKQKIPRHAPLPICLVNLLALPILGHKGFRGLPNPCLWTVGVVGGPSAHRGQLSGQACGHLPMPCGMPSQRRLHLDFLNIGKFLLPKNVSVNSTTHTGCWHLFLRRKTEAHTARVWDTQPGEGKS